MARAAAAADGFTAVAEPRRRAILELLVTREQGVTEIAAVLRIAQPSVSKHLRVLHEVGLVRARRTGRQVLYRADGETMRGLHEWTGKFEELWRHQLQRIRQRAEAAAPESPNSNLKEK